MNKIDLLDDEREQRLAAAADVVPSPLAVSATADIGIEELVGCVLDHLPSERVEIEMPNGDDAMRLLSWLYDHTRVESVDYAGGTVTVAFVARPSVAERARAKADAIDARR